MNFTSEENKLGSTGEPKPHGACYHTGGGPGNARSQKGQKGLVLGEWLALFLEGINYQFEPNRFGQTRSGVLEAEQPGG